MKYDEYFSYARECIPELIKNQCPELTETQNHIFSNYIYWIKLYKLRAIVAFGSMMTDMKDLIEQGMENTIFDQSDEVVEIVKALGDEIDNNLDTLKSMLVEKETESERKYTNKELCKRCMNSSRGLTCCMSASCELTLDDIKEEYRNLDGIKKLLKTGLVVIDKWDADEIIPEDTYFLRIKNLGDGRRTVNYSYGGCCNLLGKDGCLLSYGYRPTVGRNMKPMENEPCKDDDTIGKGISCSKELSARSFQPLQDELEEIVMTRKYTEKV